MYWLKNVICVITFPSPTPTIDNFWQYDTYDLAHNITHILDIPAIFISVFCLMLSMKYKCYLLSGLCHLIFPGTKPLKYMLKKLDKIAVIRLVLRAEKGYSYIFGMPPPPPPPPPGISMSTHLTENRVPLCPPRWDKCLKFAPLAQWLNSLMMVALHRSRLSLLSKHKGTHSLTGVT